MVHTCSRLMSKINCKTRGVARESSSQIFNTIEYINFDHHCNQYQQQHHHHHQLSWKPNRLIQDIDSGNCIFIDFFSSTLHFSENDQDHHSQYHILHCIYSLSLCHFIITLIISITATIRISVPRTTLIGKHSGFGIVNSAGP